MGDIEVFSLRIDPKKEKMKLLYNFALFGTLAYAATTIENNTADLAATKTEPESSVAVKDGTEIKKNESSAPITKVQKKHHHKKGSKGGHSGSKKRRNHNRKKKGAHKKNP